MQSSEGFGLGSVPTPTTSDLNKRIDLLIQQSEVGAIELDAAGRMLFVDSILGDNASGSRGEGAKPFATVVAAIAAAVSGDVVWVRPGNYPEEVVLKNGVNIHYCVGCTIDRSQEYGLGYTAFSDGGEYVICTISGELLYIPPYAGEGIEIFIDSSCEIYDGITGFPPTIRFTLRAVKLTGGAAVYSSGTASLFIYADEFYCVTENSGAGEMNITAANGIAVHTQSGTGQQRLYINYYTHGNGFVCSNGRQYIHSEATYAIATCSGGFQSINSIDINYLSATTAINCTAGTQRIQGGTIHGTASGDVTVSTVTVSGGDCSISVGNLLAGVSTGSETQLVPTVLVSGGTLRIINARISSIGSNAAGNPVKKTGGTLILQNCALVSGSTQACITAPTAQDVKIYGVVMASDAKHSNVTVLGNTSGLVVSTDVT